MNMKQTNKRSELPGVIMAGHIRANEAPQTAKNKKLLPNAAKRPATLIDSTFELPVKEFCRTARKLFNINAGTYS